MIIKSFEEIELIRQSALLVSKTLGRIASEIKPGVTTLQLDQIAEEFIRDHGGEPGFLGMYDFPNTLCMSPNCVVVHGYPNDVPLKEGDIISIDCGVFMNGFYGDHAYTFPVGNIDEDSKKLLEITKQSLYKGIEACKAGNRVGDIGYAIQQHTEQHGYGVVRDLVGHGLGKDLHEKPEVPNYGNRGRGKRLKNGLVLAIEPMINMKTHKIKYLSDNWTIVSADMLNSAHFEHDIAIIDGKPEILSTFKYIYQALNLPEDEEDQYRAKPFVI